MIAIPLNVVSLAEAMFVPAAGGRVRILGVTLVGVTAETGLKLLFTAGFVIVVMVLRWVASVVIRRVLGGEVADPHRFWARQGVQVIAAVVLVLGVLSIWITPHTNLSTGIGLISAGLAFALQRVILSLAAYFVILRGDTFTVGDRITLGGVRRGRCAPWISQDHDHGDGTAPIGQHRRPRGVGQLPPIHRPTGHRHQRRDLQRPSLQLHPRIPLPLGGDRAPRRL